MVSPQVRREAVTVLMRERRFGVTRACGLVQISRSLYRYRSQRPERAELRERICEIAAVKRRYGYRRVHIMLRREGWRVNRKLTYRLYREAGLVVRRRKRKRIGPFERKPLPKPEAANQSWSMDFVSDGLPMAGDFDASRSLMTTHESVLRSKSTPRSRGRGSRQCLSVSPTSAAYRDPSPWITVRSSKARCWMPGRINNVCIYRSFGPANRTRTLTSKASTASSAMNA